ncbi:MAG: PAC2 family protein [Dehalococcoidia bacterium]
MGVRYLKEPELNNPDMIAAWPGIGNIGLVAVDALREAVDAELFAEIEPWDFFYPRGLSIEDGVLTGLDFPACRFYFQNLAGRDVIFFEGEEQPAGSKRAYNMSSIVLDVAERYRCQRIFTAAAAVAPIHHTMRPRIWGVPNDRGLITEVKRYPNTVLMSDITERAGEGNITGLNGLLLGMAREREFKGVCLLGEVPVYISQFPTVYPKASKSIVEVLAYYLGIDPDVSKLDMMNREVEENIEKLYEMIPAEMKDRIEQLKHTEYLEKEAESDTITEEDKKRIMQDIEKFFDKGNRED